MISSKKRILWIDYAKFFAIYLVILGHILYLSYTPKMLYNFIYLFHVPLFFFLSGYVFNKNFNNENVCKIIDRLILPYFLYQLLYLPFHVIAQCVNSNTSLINCLLHSISGILIGDTYNTSISEVSCAPLWFLVSLAQIQFLFLFIKPYLKNIIIVSFISCIGLKILALHNIDLLFCLDNTFMAIPYFAMGYYISKSAKFNNITTFSCKNTLSTSIVITLSILTMLFILHINGVIPITLKLTSNFLNKSLILSYCSGFLGIYAMIILSKIFTKNSLLVNIIGQNTLFILFYHYLLLYIAKAVKLNILISKSDFSLVFCLILSIIILFLCFYTIRLLAAYCPFLLGKFNLCKELRGRLL